MEFLKDTSWDFLGKRKFAFALSGLLILATIVALVINGGPRYNIDFKGGEILEVGFDKTANLAEIRSIVDGLGISDAEIQSLEDGSVVLFKIPTDIEIDGKTPSEAVMEQLRVKYSESSIDLRRQELVGPKVSGELRTQAIWATLFALLGILIYVTIRFKFRFGVGAVVALFHDVIITVGLLTIFWKRDLSSRSSRLSSR